MDGTAAFPRRRLKQFAWVAIAVAIAAIAFAFWLRSAGDLAALDIRARSLGVPPTWEELGLAAGPPAGLVAWRRIGQLAGALRSYHDLGGWRLRAGAELPAPLIAHHAAFRAADLADLDQRIEALPGDGLVLRDGCTYELQLPELSWLRDLCRLQSERMLLDRPEAFPAHSRRLLALVGASRAPQAAIERLVAAGCLSYWAQAAAWRLRRGDVAGAEIAGQAEAARAILGALMQRALDGEFRIWRQFAHDVHRGRGKAVADLEAQLGVARGFGVGRTVLRVGRGTALGLLLDGAGEWNGAADVAALLAAAGRMEARYEALAQWSPGRGLYSMYATTFTALLDARLRADAQLQVLAAEADGRPWPADPTDPAGGTIRRVEREGQVIGGYLLGRNRSDDGGRTRGDLCFPLYDRLGSPRAADKPLDP